MKTPNYWRLPMRELYLFNNGSPFKGWNDCYSMTDDGHVLGNHICSADTFMMHDLHDRPGRLKVIKEYFKDEDYQVIVIPSDEVRNHEGLKKAFELNQKLREKAEELPE